jgi:hypothetical protein
MADAPKADWRSLPAFCLGLFVGGLLWHFFTPSVLTWVGLTVVDLLLVLVLSLAWRKYQRARPRFTEEPGTRRVDPPQRVQVHRDGSWHDARLEAWRQDGDELRAYVRYTVGAEMEPLEWVAAERVKTT